MNYYIHWIDPDDPDNGTNTGFETFIDHEWESDPEDLALDWLNERIKIAPNLKFTIIKGEEVPVEPVEYVARYKIQAGKIMESKLKKR